MAAWQPPRGGRERVYYLLPAEGLAAFLGSQGSCALGPLAGPEPPPAIVAPPEPAPAGGPSYGPRERTSPDPSAPRGYFLDRYVY